MDHLLHSTKCAESVPESLAIDKSAVEMLVRWYAREAGVHTLVNYIDKITRKLVLQLVIEGEGTKLNEKSSTRKSDSWNLTEDNVDQMYEKDPLLRIMVFTVRLFWLASTPSTGSHEMNCHVIAS
jgi:ATP-dependent Lon protease